MASISLVGERSSDAEKDAILGIVRQIRNQAHYQCPMVVMVEAAPGIAASYVERYLREANIPDFFMMKERRGYMEGVPKTEAITVEYVYELTRALRPQGTHALLGYASEIITHKRNPVKEKARLHSMMRNLRKVFRKTMVEHGDTRFFYTAKIGASPDDMLIALGRQLLSLTSRSDGPLLAQAVLARRAPKVHRGAAAHRHLPRRGLRSVSAHAFSSC